MSAFKSYKFSELERLEQHLNGALRGGKDPRKGYFGLTSKTLVFTKPSSFTVTFVPTSSTPGNTDAFNFSDVKTQIEAASGGTLKVFIDGAEIVFVEPTPSQGVLISSGTALSDFGFTAGAKSLVYSYPDGFSAAIAPHWVQTYFANGNHVLLVKE